MKFCRDELSVLALVESGLALTPELNRTPGSCDVVRWSPTAHSD